MRLATANILHKLPAHKASNALAIVLGQRPQIVALQEWGGSRSSILRNAGAFTRLPRMRMRRVTEGYSFAAPASGGPPVGVDASWGEIVSVRSLLLAPKRAADRATRGVEAIIQEHATGRVHAVLNIHLLAHHDDPAHLRGWNEGREACEKWARSWTGYDRWVLGDTNRHLMDLPPLHSCWERHPAEPTFGKRTIDIIYGNERADAVRAFRTGSDHRAVIADYS